MAYIKTTPCIISALQQSSTASVWKGLAWGIRQYRHYGNLHHIVVAAGVSFVCGINYVWPSAKLHKCASSVWRGNWNWNCISNCILNLQFHLHVACFVCILIISYFLTLIAVNFNFRSSYDSAEDNLIISKALSPTTVLCTHIRAGCMLEHLHKCPWTWCAVVQDPY